MKSKSGNSLRSVLAHIVLIVLSFMCLFFFYILIINATRSHAELQKGFSALPGTHLLENLKNVANDGSFPMFRGIINSICISTACAGLCTYFSALTAYGLYAYEFKTRKIAFTFYHGNLVMPTQVTAMGFLRLITKMGLYDTCIRSLFQASRRLRYSILCTATCSHHCPWSLVEAARIDG